MDRRTFIGTAGVAAVAGCSDIQATFSDDQLGQTFATNDGLEMTVDRIEALPGGTAVTDEFELSAASDEVAVVLPHLVARNTTETPVSVPGLNDIFLQSGGVVNEPYQQIYQDEIDTFGSMLLEPAEGPLFPPTNELGPEEETGGWLLFRVPNPDETVVVEVRAGEHSLQWTVPI